MEDTSSPYYINGSYEKSIPLKQTKAGWSMDEDSLNVGGITKNSIGQWISEPTPGKSIKIYYQGNQMHINWSGESFINRETAADFLTKDILNGILGDKYSYKVVNSNEPYSQNGGTQKFSDYANANGINMEDYGAKTWQIIYKDGSTNQILEKPAIYWSTVELTPDNVGKDKNIPVMGYRDGKYDVYLARTIKYPSYCSIDNSSFTNVKNDGTGATFQYEDYYEAKAMYEELLRRYNANGNVSYSDINDLGLS
ncbi:MAG: hypothetical protein Q4B60_01425 [Erysipelotrichaceae bacterium]|nr:hypothetical protein [Erysipelotrichaceae bacterium]